MATSILTLEFRRRDLKDQISILRARHRKRKPMLDLLKKLTTQQLRAEIKAERQSRSA